MRVGGLKGVSDDADLTFMNPEDRWAASVECESLSRICVFKYHVKDGLGIKYGDCISEFPKRMDSRDVLDNEETTHPL